MTNAAFTPMHHPGADLLSAYAAGSLDESASLLVAAHLTFCPECRAAVADLEGLGGALMEDLAPAEMDETALDALLARLDEADASPLPGPAVEAAPRGDLAALPAPIRAYLDTDGALPWRAMAPGIKQVVLKPRTAEGANVRLFKVAPRTPLPDHGHAGGEWTLVLTGSFTDRDQRFARGDVAEAGGDTVHAPRTGADECICLVVTDAPLRYSGLLGRLAQPFTGM